ncbi:MAG: type II toxin-antitoxin system VapC family toxin [Treponema sp.]|nr:type II toxin-antitoxin system VapC family toxin [Treponema sp.]
MIVDTDVLIWYLRGNAAARKALNSNHPFKISVITYLELIQGVGDKRELRILQKYLRQWPIEIIQINESISSLASFFVENYFLSHSMETGDAIIAATAIENQEVILTANDKHYSFIPNIQINKFRPK